jgi:hypothetical protein
MAIDGGLRATSRRCFHRRRRVPLHYLVGKTRNNYPRHHMPVRQEPSAQEVVHTASLHPHG